MKVYRVIVSWGRIGEALVKDMEHISILNTFDLQDATKFYNEGKGKDAPYIEIRMWEYASNTARAGTYIRGWSKTEPYTAQDDTGCNGREFPTWTHVESGLNT